MRRPHPALFALALAALAPACLEDTSKRVDCGSGDNVAHAGESFCVFSAALIIEGFNCPAAVPFMFPGEGGAVICAPEEELPPGGADAIMEKWEPEDPTPDAVGGDTALPPADSLQADTTPAEDAGPLDTFLSADTWMPLDTAPGPDAYPY